MGFSLKGLGEKLFGGTDNSQQKEQLRQNEYSRRYTQQQTAQGRSDLNTLYDRADQARNFGYNQMLDLMQMRMPVQSNYFQGGNVAAQQAILGGQPMIYQAPQLDTAFLDQYRMPQYGSPELEQIPMLSRAIGWQDQVPGNMGRTQVIPGTADPYAGMSAQAAPAPGGGYPGVGSGNRGEPPYPGAVWNGRFGRWV